MVAAPSSYHEFVGPEALRYDGPGTDAGNEYKIKKVYSDTAYRFILCGIINEGPALVNEGANASSRNYPLTTPTPRPQSRSSSPSQPATAVSAPQACV